MSEPTATETSAPEKGAAEAPAGAAATEKPTGEGEGPRHVGRALEPR